ncbi:LysR family transcriptional regulator [Nakamurella silvestris]|nr:LysR family transcriptional regulator [Nakamurella silvestris]
MALDPGRLRLLAELSDLGTVRAVAQNLTMSPSAVSQQLAVLEREARTKLLERHGRRVVLTPAGTRLVAHAREILERIESAEADLRELGREPVGPVRVAAFASALGSVVIPALARLAEKYPQLVPVTVELEPQESVPALRRGECDVAVVADFLDGSTPLDSDIVTVPVTGDLLTVVRPVGHPTVSDLSDLAGERFVLDSANSHLSHLVLRLCRQSGFEPEVVGRYRSYSLLLQQVEAGRAVTVLPGLAVDRRYRVQATPVEPLVKRQISVVTRAGSTPRRGVQAFIEELRAAAG